MSAYRPGGSLDPAKQTKRTVGGTKRRHGASKKLALTVKDNGKTRTVTWGPALKTKTATVKTTTERKKQSARRK
jgi:hypothetical protein